MHVISLFNKLFCQQNLRRLEWLGLIAIFLVIGTVDHDPWWKRGEAWGFGIIYHFYITHTWLIPMNGDAPFMEKPPLYYWTSVLFCDLFGKILPLHDAARLSSVLYTAVAAIFTWKASDVLFAQHSNHKAMRTISALLLLGTYGLVRLSHAMVTDIALVAGTAIAIYGAALLCKQPDYWKAAGTWLGLGIGVTFMTKGLFIPVALGVSGVIVWYLLPKLHRPATAKAVTLAIVVAFPLFFIWPALVYYHSPALFMKWFWNNNIGRFIGFSVYKLGAENDRPHMLVMLPVFTFPTVLLACAEVYWGRAQWRKAEYVLPLVVSIIIMVMLFISASGRTPYFLPLLPGFSLLATQAIMRLPPRFLTYWNVVTRIAFSLFAAGVWVVWWNLLYPPEHRPIPWLIRHFDDIFPPDFIIQDHQIVGCCFAVIVALFWLFSFRLKGNSALNTARIWFVGAALVWCTTHTLLMPWINDTHSFRKVVLQMQDFVDHSPYKGQCIASYQLGENMAPMLEYFTGRKEPLPSINLDNTFCPLFLTFPLRDAPVDIDPHRHMIWHGTRLLDIKGSELRLYEQKK